MATETGRVSVNLTRASREISSVSNVSATDCFIYRSIAIIYVCLSIIFFAFNTRFILVHRHRLNPLALSLIVSSLLLIVASLPYVIAQAIQCTPVQSYLICCLEGFLCFTCGTCVMYTMCCLSLVQYIRLFYNTTVLYRMLEHKTSFLLPVFCWLVAFLWSLPPFMDIKPGFMREGQGFDCGLNWKQPDVNSRLYIILAFINIYFLPLFCLLFTHLRILVLIRKLVRRQYPTFSKEAKSMPVDMRHRLLYVFTMTESNRLKRLRIDRRFAEATMITVLYYMLAWTPYAICGLLQTSTTMHLIDVHLPSMLISGSALTAKMSVIGQPFVYFYTVRPSNQRFSITSAMLK